MMQYQRYPLTMTHPGFRPAVISDDNAAGRGGTAPPGRPVQFPNVVVNNEDQEEQHAAKGYQPSGAPSQDDFVRLQAAAVPAGHQKQEYPRWENGLLVQDPGVVPDLRLWPMWVHPPGADPLIVRDADDYERVMGHPYEMRGSTRNEPVKRGDEPAVEPDELAEFRAWKAAQAAQAALQSEAPAEDAEAAEDDREQVIDRAEELGVLIDRRWSTERIRKALEGATTENADLRRV